MSLLVLDHVSRRVRHGTHERIVLRDVSLQLDRGELVAVWGPRRSGRSTLMRVAAGIEPPSSGQVRFDGKRLRARSGGALGSGIGYCQRPLRSAEAREVLDELIVGQLARGVPRPAARTRALAALERCAAQRSAGCGLHELDTAEEARAIIARALVLAPAMLVVDEPTKGVDLLERDKILALLRSLADEGLAVLISAGEATALAGADRALSLSGGILRGSVAPALAEVVALPRRALA